MEKNLTYRSSSKGVAEQYGISLSKKMLTDMGITPANRKVLVNYDEKTKTITITKKYLFYFYPPPSLVALNFS